MAGRAFRPRRSTQVVIRSGDVIEVREYERGCPYGWRNPLAGRTKERSDRYEDNRKLGIRRTRVEFMRLVNANFYPGRATGWTLTIAENVTDVDEADLRYRTFVKRFRRVPSLRTAKILAVREQQERGAWHYHCIIDRPFIDHALVMKLWGEGVVWVEQAEQVDNWGAYCSKYFTKAIENPALEGRKRYLRSGKLEQPEVLRGERAWQVAMAMRQAQKPVREKVYSSDYHGVITYAQYNLARQKRQPGRQAAGDD